MGYSELAKSYSEKKKQYKAGNQSPELYAEIHSLYEKMKSIQKEIGIKTLPTGNYK